jgi:uncharacterized membrane protein YeaQ/YmgE (transglycosylase-associated protein family)
MDVLGYDITNLLMWLILGITSGLIAHLGDHAQVKGGLFSSIVTGLIGAVAGGGIANIYMGAGITGFNISSLFIAIAGSLLVLYLYRFFFRRRAHIKS